MTDKELERKLKALANRRRLQILKYLKRTPKSSVGEIATEIKLSFRSTSRHLAILSATDMVEKEQEGLTMFYYLATPLTFPAKQILSIG